MAPSTLTRATSDPVRVAKSRSFELAVRLAAGEDVRREIAQAVHTLTDTDMVGVNYWRGCVADTTDGLFGSRPGRVFTAEEMADATRVVHAHPVFAVGGIATRKRCFRLSDELDLRTFWGTEPYYYQHGRFGARFPAGLVLGDARHGMFIGPHRERCDYSGEEMTVLAALAEPLSSAVAFRMTLDDAAAALRDDPAAPSDPRGPWLSPRECEVMALVARGWTDQRIGHTLGITARTVRKHLGNAREKAHAGNRAEAAAWWARHRADPL